MRLILQFCLLLLVLLGAEPRAWGKVDVGQNIASGGLPLILVDCTDGDAPPALITQGEPGPWDYEPAPDVCNGPNLYAYVKQNPWTCWDPDGLNLVSQLLKKGVKVVQNDLDGVAKVGGRRVKMPDGLKPGETFKLPGEAGKKYPGGVKFDEQGFPDFSPYRQGPDVKINMKGDDSDFSAADKAAGISRKDRDSRGLTWHHHQDGETMQLVPSDLNGNVPHTGGAAITRSARKTAESMGLFVGELVAPNTTAAYMSGGAGAAGYARALVKDIGENADPGIGLIATRENAEKAGKGFWNTLSPGEGNYGDFSQSKKYDMWESIKGTAKDAWGYLTEK
jgi:hypothetical protein